MSVFSGHTHAVYIYPPCLFRISILQKFSPLCHCPSTRFKASANLFKPVSTGDAGLSCLDLSPVTPASCASVISKGCGWFGAGAAAWTRVGRGPAPTVGVSSCSSEIWSWALRFCKAWTGKCHINGDRSVTACGYLDLAHVFKRLPNILHNESISIWISSQTWYCA